MESWVGVAGTLGGVVVGGLISYFISARQIAHEKSLASNKRQIEKIEKAHEFLTSIKASYRSEFGKDTTLLISGMKPDQQAGGRMPFEELEMLFSFYVPSLEAESKYLIELCQNYGESMVQARIYTPKSKEERRSLWNELKAKHESVESHISFLKAELAKVIRNHVM